MMNHLIFALGGDGSYFFMSSTKWHWNNTSSSLESLLNEGKVPWVRSACLGENPEKEYLFNYVLQDGEARVDKVGYSHGLPKELLDFCFKEDGKEWKRCRDLKVALGPNKSFFAWDSSGIRWKGIPDRLEKTIQSWLSPSGWIYGPPQHITLGKDGSYFAKAQRLAGWDYSIRGTCPKLQDVMTELVKENKNPIQCAWLNPALDDSYVIVCSDTRVYSNNVGDSTNLLKVAKSFASPEISEIYSREEELEKVRQKKAREEAQARQEKEKAERKQKEEQKRVLHALYNKWRKECDVVFQSSEITNFPHFPVEACVCEDLVCKQRKVEKMLLACRHDVERLLRASDQYSLDWLRNERLAWHPDRFGRKCNPEHKDTLLKQTTELYAIFESLIADEKPAG